MRSAIGSASCVTNPNQENLALEHTVTESLPLFRRRGIGNHPDPPVLRPRTGLRLFAPAEVQEGIYRGPIEEVKLEPTLPCTKAGIAVSGGGYAFSIVLAWFVAWISRFLAYRFMLRRLLGEFLFLPNVGGRVARVG